MVRTPAVQSRQLWSAPGGEFLGAPVGIHRVFYAIGGAASNASISVDVSKSSGERISEWREWSGLAIMDLDASPGRSPPPAGPLRPCPPEESSSSHPAEDPDVRLAALPRTVCSVAGLLSLVAPPVSADGASV